MVFGTAELYPHEALPLRRRAIHLERAGCMLVNAWAALFRRSSRVRLKGSCAKVGSPPYYDINRWEGGAVTGVHKPAPPGKAWPASRWQVYY